VTSPAPLEGARRGEAQIRGRDAAGWFSPWLGAATASPRDFGVVVGPSVVGLHSRQRWREKGGRHSCSAKSRGIEAGEGGGGVSSVEAKRGNGEGSAGAMRRGGVGVWCWHDARTEETGGGRHDAVA
jgi:hypothetical protein